MVGDTSSCPEYPGSPLCALSSSRRLDQLPDVAATRYPSKMARAEATMFLYSKAPDFTQQEFPNMLLIKSTHMPADSGEMGKQMPLSTGGAAKTL